MARVRPPTFTRRLAEASKMIGVVTGFVEQTANLLRQLVHLIGWLVLLTGSVSLLIHPDPSPKHLVIPGAGAVAVLQGLIRPRQQQKDMDTMILLDNTPLLTVDSSPREIEDDGKAERQPDQTEDL